jgi:hypothetical protein
MSRTPPGQSRTTYSQYQPRNIAFRQGRQQSFNNHTNNHF